MIAAVAAHAVFLFELAGVPVGTVELLAEGQVGTYRSTHLFNRDEHRAIVTEKVSFSLDPRPPHAVTWHLYSRPGMGCSEVYEELGDRRRGQLCVTAEKPGWIKGTVFGEAFEAWYETDKPGQLRELLLADARFLRVPPGVKVPSPPDLFGKGFPIEGKGEALAMSPPRGRAVVAPKGTWEEAEARAMAADVNASFAEQRPTGADFAPEDVPAATAGTCVAHVRRFLHRAQAAGKSAELIFGMVAQGNRAYAHAWVRVGLKAGGSLELDPTRMEEVKPATHLALPSGRAYLDLLAGKAKVVRR